MRRRREKKELIPSLISSSGVAPIEVHPGKREPPRNLKGNEPFRGLGSSHRKGNNELRGLAEMKRGEGKSPIMTSKPEGGRMEKRVPWPPEILIRKGSRPLTEIRNKGEGKEGSLNLQLEENLSRPHYL